MTKMQKEIEVNGNLINQFGYLIGFGFTDIKPESESLYNQTFARLIIANDERRKMQEETFQQMPWIKNKSGSLLVSGIERR